MLIQFNRYKLLKLDSLPLSCGSLYLPRNWSLFFFCQFGGTELLITFCYFPINILGQVVMILHSFLILWICLFPIFIWLTCYRFINSTDHFNRISTSFCFHWFFLLISCFQFHCFLLWFLLFLFSDLGLNWSSVSKEGII